MNALIDQERIPKLAEVYPPFAAKMAEVRRLTEKDLLAAEKAFTEAQALAKAFYAGVEYARGRS